MPILSSLGEGRTNDCLMLLVVTCYQDLNVRVCVCVCVDVRGAGLDYSDTRPSYFNLLNLELHKECLRTLGMGWNLPEQVSRLQALSGCNRGAAVEADAIGEQQPKRTQLGSC